MQNSTPSHRPTFCRPRHRLLALGIAAGAAFFGATSTSAATYSIAPGGDANKVVFESKAPLESFEGSTRQISGSVTLDPAALTDSMTVEVVVDLASLDTGIDMRNQHMRENHLHTDRYPQAIFRGATFVGEHPASLAPGKTAKCKIAGSFSLHGVTRRIEVPIELRLDEKSGGLAVKAQFVVYLADYEIPRPKMLFVKLDEKQAVTFEALALPK